MSSAKIKNSFTKWGIHPHCNEAPDYTKLSTIFEGSKLNAATQTLSTQSFETKRLRENSVLVALGAQRQIISKGCDDSVLCSYRFEALLFSKREKWIEFVFEAELMPYGSRTEASINLTKDATSIIPPMIKIKKEFIGESVSCNLVGDPSSFCIKTQDNLSIESDQEDEIGLGLGEDVLLNPPIKIEVDDLRNQGKEIIHKELLLDPLAQLDVDAELLLSSLLDNSVKRAKPELVPPQDLVSKDSLLVKEEWDDEKFSYTPSNSEANLERELIKKKKEFIGESVNCNFEGDPSSFSIKTQDNFSIESDQEDEIGLGFGEDVLLNPPIKIEVDDLRDQGKEIIHKELLLDPLAQLDVDAELLLSSLLDNSVKRAKPELVPPQDLVSKDSLLVKEEWDDEKFTYPPSSSEANLERELATDSSNKDQLRRTSIEKFHPLLKECFVRVERLPRKLAARYEANKAFKFTEKIKEQMKFFSESTRKLSDDSSPSSKRIRRTPELTDNVNLEPESKSVYAICEDNIDSVHKLKSIYCTMCHMTFSTKASLNMHIFTVHKMSELFKCNSCSYVCSENETLSIHLKFVHKIMEPYKCTDCDFAAPSKDNLNIHMKYVHGILKPFKCLECNGSFSEKYELFRHVNSSHKKIKPFKCLECNYTCSEKGQLESHTKSVHLKIKPFKCMKCNYSSSHNCILLRHVKAVHEKRLY